MPLLEERHLDHLIEVLPVKRIYGNSHIFLGISIWYPAVLILLMLILTASDVRKTLLMPDIISVMKDAFSAYSQGAVTSPLRTRIDMPGTDNSSLFMSVHVSVPGEECTAVKTVTIFPENSCIGKLVVQVAVTLFDTVDGAPLALLEGSSLPASAPFPYHKVFLPPRNSTH